MMIFALPKTDLFETKRVMRFEAEKVEKKGEHKMGPVLPTYY
jgi:hypothetical protein